MRAYKYAARHTPIVQEFWYIKDLSPYNINLYILLRRMEPPLIRHKELSAAGCASFRLSSLSAAHTHTLLARACVCFKCG